jgi:hypothetical protein
MGVQADILLTRLLIKPLMKPAGNTQSYASI